MRLSTAPSPRGARGSCLVVAALPPQHAPPFETTFSAASTISASRPHHRQGPHSRSAADPCRDCSTLQLLLVQSQKGKEAAADVHARREARGLSGSLLRSELPRRVPLISCKRARKIYPAFFLACARYSQSSVGGALTRLSLGPPIQPWKKSLKDPNLAPSLLWDSSKIWRRPARPVVWRWGRPRLCRHCWDVREIRPGTTA